ncbi:CAP-Gly domain-containing linker protein 1-like [Dysidea avara]|uniref:CAP-Gly domain-containing linker protein 1-like n=1 Tax=Dysidea avara TaxID=196820 RepID=UPI00333461DE
MTTMSDAYCTTYNLARPVENREPVNMYKKKTKQRQFRPSSMGLLREPSPVENRVHVRQNIIDELDMIKTRVDQPSAAAVSIPVKALENLFKKHEALGARREKELSSVKEFFKKCLERFFDEAAAAELNYSTNEHHIPDINEFVSAIQNAFQMVQQLKTLNAQLVAKMSDALRLEKTIKGMIEELESLKSHNSYLMQRNETEKSKLSEIEISNRELAETVQKLRTEVNSLKHKAARHTSTSQQVNHHANSFHAASRQFSQADKNETTHAGASQSEAASHSKTIIVPSTSTTNQQKEEKEEQVPTAVASKKQSSTKHTSRLLEQQLNTMEELLMQGQKKMNAVEKEIAELTNMTDETLSHKYREQYNCLCEAVDVIMILLGREGSEKLMMTLSNAAPNNIFGDKKLVIPINNLADVIKSAVSRVMLELKLFIKLKWMHQRKLAAIPNKRTLLTSEDAKKSINELQKWLDKELKGIDEEIIGSVQHYEEHKKEIETTQVAYFDQLSKKVDGTIQKLYKSMEKLEVPDEIESMLGNILATVEQLNDNPAPKLKPHTSPMESTEEEIVATNVVGGNANWLSTFSIPG